jgi:hypothetical protein
MRVPLKCSESNRRIRRGLDPPMSPRRLRCPAAGQPCAVANSVVVSVLVFSLGRTARINGGEPGNRVNRRIHNMSGTRKSGASIAAWCECEN